MARDLAGGGLAMIYAAGQAGADVRNDCQIELRPNQPPIQVRSPVKSIYGRQIEATVRSALDELGLSDCGADVADSGAFDFCLRARVEAAAERYGVARRLELQNRPAPGLAARPRRTRLYLPGNTPKFFINAALHGADAIILDLEDAVPPNEKDEARALVRHALSSVDFGACERIVRINSGDLGRKDLEAIEEAGADTVLVPKVETPQDLTGLGTQLHLIPLIETARGIANAFELAQVPGVVALTVGVEDYLTDIGGERGNPEAMTFAYGQIINAARAHGIPPLASVYGNIDDREGHFRETKRLVSMGFEGVGCLHPSQIATALRAFQPTEDEIEKARHIVRAFDAHGGAVSVEGRMVDAPVAERARRVLARAENSLPAWRIV